MIMIERCIERYDTQLLPSMKGSKVG
jgi:hypothetical protein